MPYIKTKNTRRRIVEMYFIMYFIQRNFINTDFGLPRVSVVYFQTSCRDRQNSHFFRQNLKFINKMQAAQLCSKILATYHSVEL